MHPRNLLSIAAAHYFGDGFGEAVLWAENALIRNPRFSHALRIRAAGLAREGKVGEAAAVVRQILDIEPDLTVTRLRTRLMFMDESCWSRYALGLRAAGLPE